MQGAAHDAADLSHPHERVGREARGDAAGTGKKHRKETLYDGHCQLLKAAFDLDDKARLPAQRQGDMDRKATFAALLLEMAHLLRDVVRAENPQKGSPTSMRKRRCTNRRGAPPRTTQRAAPKQASDIHRPLLD